MRQVARKEINLYFRARAAAGPVAIDMSASTFPALTTTFTPPAECTSSYIETCTDTDYCYGNAFPTGGSFCGAYGPGTNYDFREACYPEVTLTTDIASAYGSFSEYTYWAEVYSYSPGLYCPKGMTTATSMPLLDGIFCCPR
jgi:hypothetical protein